MGNSAVFPVNLIDSIMRNPWREYEKLSKWNIYEYDGIMEDISEAMISEIINIACVGPIKSGKSSFLNTVSSIDKGRISQRTSAGEAVNSVTKKLVTLQTGERFGDLRLYDTMGMCGDSGIYLDDIKSLIQGNLPSNFMFIPASPADENTEGFRTNAEPTDKMHALVFVIDIMLVAQENIPSHLRKQIQDTVDMARSNDIPAFVVLTKVDTLSTKVKEDVSRTYKSVAIKDAVDKAKELFRIQGMNIFPVQNYTDETKPFFKMEILTLLALRQMINFALDHIESMNTT